MKTAIPSHPNYILSDDGIVFNARTGRTLAGGINAHGYRYVKLHGNGPVRNVTIHSLVAEAFVPRTNPRANQIDHLDGNQENNCADNLEWVTCKENIRRAIARGNHPASPLHRLRRLLLESTREGAEQLLEYALQPEVGMPATSRTLCPS